ncbi:hypothetical protein ACFV0R_33985 [Streptomyces sp. NPDC059578]|uniref:hypothetical protein n=1 Tax=Streptomyces sp. NPDC059578 TaxID=3346874 RepID=UPI0036AFA74E
MDSFESGEVSESDQGVDAAESTRPDEGLEPASPAQVSDEAKSSHPHDRDEPDEAEAPVTADEDADRDVTSAEPAEPAGPQASEAPEPPEEPRGAETSDAERDAPDVYVHSEERGEPDTYGSEATELKETPQSKTDEGEPDSDREPGETQSVELGEDPLDAEGEDVEASGPESADAADEAADPIAARTQAARAEGLIDEGGRVPVEERESGDRVRGRPCDDTGYEIRGEDLEYLGLDEKQVAAWQRFEAPLGMTSEQFSEFKSSLNDALAADGIDPDQVDLRLQGSSAQFFSGSHKDFPTEESLVDQPEALSRLTEWMGDRAESERPSRIPFDAKHLLGVDSGDGGIEDPSDYDVQISSDAMVEKATEVWEAADPAERKPEMIHPKYHFVNKATMEEAFPALVSWADDWESRTGREVAPALFRSGGPPDQTGVGRGVSAHFRETDWIMNRPGGDRDE